MDPLTAVLQLADALVGLAASVIRFLTETSSRSNDKERER